MASTPSELNTGAACYKCLSEGDLLAALVYLLNTNLMSTQDLNTNAACYKCLSQGEQLAAIVYLLASGNAGGQGGQSGTGSPQGVVTASPGGIYIDVTNPAAPVMWVKVSGTGTNIGWTELVG